MCAGCLPFARQTLKQQPPGRGADRRDSANDEARTGKFDISAGMTKPPMQIFRVRVDKEESDSHCSDEPPVLLIDLTFAVLQCA